VLSSGQRLPGFTLSPQTYNPEQTLSPGDDMVPQWVPCFNSDLTVVAAAAAAVGASLQGCHPEEEGWQAGLTLLFTQVFPVDDAGHHSPFNRPLSGLESGTCHCDVPRESWPDTWCITSCWRGRGRLMGCELLPAASAQRGSCCLPTTGGLVFMYMCQLGPTGPHD